MNTVTALRHELIEAQDDLVTSEDSLRTQTRVMAAGTAVAGLLAGSAELVPSQTARGIMIMSGLGIGFLTLIGPGLDAWQMKSEFVNPRRRDISRLETAIQSELRTNPELDLGLA